jgi:hypothetical protein
VQHSLTLVWVGVVEGAVLKTGGPSCWLGQEVAVVAAGAALARGTEAMARLGSAWGEAVLAGGEVGGCVNLLEWQCAGSRSGGWRHGWWRAQLVVASGHVLGGGLLRQEVQLLVSACAIQVSFEQHRIICSFFHGLLKLIWRQCLFASGIVVTACRRRDVAWLTDRLLTALRLHGILITISVNILL